MFKTGKCPNNSCGKTLTNVRIEEMPIHQAFQHAYHGVSYICPHCQTILGVGIDPVALKTDTVDAVVKKLKGGR